MLPPIANEVGQLLQTITRHGLSTVTDLCADADGLVVQIHVQIDWAELEKFHNTPKETK